MKRVTPNLLQKQALLSLQQSKRENKNKYLAVLPSGIGKTYLSAFETFQFNGRILYLVHRNEILNQASSVFKSVHNIDDKDIGFFNQERKEVDKKYVFATIQTLSRKKNLGRLNPHHFDYIILDEYHHVAALSYQRVLHFLKPKFLLGMTATPERMDGKDILASVSSNVPYRMSLGEGIESGMLVPFVYFGLWDDVDYSDIMFNGLRYTEKDLNKKLLIDKRDDAIIREFRMKIRSRKCIGFCCSVKHVKRCVEKFNQSGIRAAGITYKTHLRDRELIIDAFRRGKYQVIFTRDIFNEGIDFPEVEGLLFLRPTFSKTVFYQQLGRGLRRRMGKKDVIVLDFIGNYAKAYKIRVWLKEIILTGHVRERKPEYQYDVPVVHFDTELIDLFDKQELGSRYSKQFLIDEYMQLKKKLKKAPVVSDVGQFLQHSLAPYDTHWGSWGKFKIYMKDNAMNITAEQIKQQLLDFYNRHGRVPTVRDLRKYHLHSDNTVREVYGTYAKCLEEIGLRPNMYKNYLSKQRLIDDFKRIEKEIGDVPFNREIEERVNYNFYSGLQRHFHCSYMVFLKMLGKYDAFVKRLAKVDRRRKNSVI